MTTIILSIIAAVAIIALAVLVYFVYKYLTNSTKQEQKLCELNGHVYGIYSLLNSKQEKPKVKTEGKPKTNNNPNVKINEQKEKEVKVVTNSTFSPLQEQERERMINAIKQHKGSLHESAMHLKMSLLMFYTKAKKYGLVDNLNSKGRVLKKWDNILKYIKLRNSGITLIDATAKLKVSAKTAKEYELVYLTNK